MAVKLIKLLKQDLLFFISTQSILNIKVLTRLLIRTGNDDNPIVLELLSTEICTYQMIKRKI